MERIGFEGVDVLQRGIGTQLVPGLVKQCGGEVFDRAVALVEGARLDDLVDQRLRHRLARLVMLGVVGEHLRIKRPVLVELRGELDEVTRGAGAGNARILHVREHAMQGVAELVEHGGHVIEAEQRGLALGRLGVVADIEHHRLGAGQAVLLDEHVHPGATALARALVVIGVEQGELLAVGVEHIEHAHIRMVDRQVVAFLEGQAVELVGSKEHAVSEARDPARSRA